MTYEFSCLREAQGFYTVDAKEAQEKTSEDKVVGQLITF